MSAACSKANDYSGDRIGPRLRSNKTIQVQKTPGKQLFYVVVPLDGQKNWIPAGSIRRGAERLCSQYNKQLLLGEFQQLKKATVAEFYKAWIVDHAETEMEPASLVLTKGVFERFYLPRFGKLQIGSVDAHMIRKLTAELKRSGLSPATIARYLTPLRTFFKCAIEWRYDITENPMKTVKNSEAEEEKAVFLDRPEIPLFLTAANPFYRYLFEVDIHTGLRKGEMFGLKLPDLDFEKREINVERTLYPKPHYFIVAQLPDGTAQRHPAGDSKIKAQADLEKRMEADEIGAIFDLEKAIYGPPKTKGSIRKVNMSPRVVTVLKEWLAVRPESDTDFVFVTKQGCPIRARNFDRRHFYPALERAGIDYKTREITPHALRQTNATLRVLAGENIRYIQEQLGHEKITTTEIYFHLFPEVANHARDLF